MREIIIIIGLPGSGKTTLAQSLNDGSYFLFDDMNKNFHQLNEAINHDKIIITDPTLCLYRKSDIEAKISEFFGETSIQFIAFENNAEKACKNSKKRIDKIVSKSYIYHLSTRYNTHQFDKVVPIYEG